jgi:hypothetical protein
MAPVVQGDESKPGVRAWPMWILTQSELVSLQHQKNPTIPQSNSESRRCSPPCETRNAVAHQPVGLELFGGNPRQPMPAGLAYRLEDYLKLVDWTGRQIREDKRGRIEDEVPPILNRLGIASAHWLYRSISRSTMKVVSSRWWEVYERPVNRWAGRKVIVYRRARCCLGDGGGSVSRKSQ